jgi:hypothetical protein
VPESALNAAAPAPQPADTTPHADAMRADLAAIYPDDRERDDATKCFAWIAWSMGQHSQFGWWHVPHWVGEPKLRIARVAIGTITLAVTFALGVALFDPQASLGAGILVAVLAWWRGNRIKPGRLRRAELPQALIPRWPRSWGEWARMVVGLGTGVLLRTILVRIWACPIGDGSSATGDSTYTACRRSTAVDGLVCVISGLPVAVLAFWWYWPMLFIGGLIVGNSYLAALADGNLPPVKVAELVLLLQWRRRMKLHRLLGRAADRQLLQPAGVYYRFRDPLMQQYLSDMYQAGVDARARRIPDAVAAAKPGVRTRLISLASNDTIAGSAAKVAVGAGVTFSVLVAKGQIEHGIGWDSWLFAALSWVGMPIAAAALTYLLLAGLVRASGWSLWMTSRVPHLRIAVPVGLIGIAGLVVSLVGPGVIRHGIAVAAVTLVPFGLVLGVGGWAAALIHRQSQAANRRWWQLTADALLVAIGVAVVLMIARPNLLGAQGAVGLLFPVAVWLSVRAWRAMNSWPRPAVRAVTDIAVSLLLGASLVGLLVWAANLLRMPPEEVAVLREVLHHVGSVVDLKWWIWVSVYVLLAAVSVAGAKWPATLGAVTRWLARLRIVKSANAGRRVLTGLHIGLLVTAFIGLAAPAAVAPGLSARLAERYTETLSDDLKAHRELDAYNGIRRAFSAPPAPGSLAVLAAMITRIHEVSKPGSDTAGGSSIELDLAYRMGQLQGMSLAVDASRGATPADKPPGQPGGVGSTVRSAAELSTRIDKLDAQRDDQHSTAEAVRQAGELAAKVVAASLSIFTMGELVSVIREYLSGLVENSPLTDVLARGVGRFTGDRLVIPDKQRLKAAAVEQVDREIAARPVDDPEAVARLQDQRDPVAAAVDLTNQARYLEEGGGTCDGCAKPEPSDREPGRGGEDFKPVFEK